MHRKNAPAEDKDPAKMTDEELDAALTEVRNQAAKALFDKKHPMHREALRMLAEMPPGIVIPETMLDDAPAIAS